MNHRQFKDFLIDTEFGYRDIHYYTNILSFFLYPKWPSAPPLLSKIWHWRAQYLLAVKYLRKFLLSNG
jgi:hypothetical protein